MENRHVHATAAAKVAFLRMDQPIIPTFNQLQHDARPLKPFDAGLQGPTVLVADASALFRRNLGTILQKEGYRMLYAESGLDAVGICAKERPDLVLLEAEIPGISGIAACQAMRERLGMADLYVFMTLAQEREDSFRAAQAAGAHVVLYKPIEIDPLVDTINALLAPKPTPQTPLTLRAVKTQRSCHVTGWRPRSRGLTLDPGPEFEWLGENLPTGIKVQIAYMAEDGSRIVRMGSLRQVWKNLNQKALEVTFGKEIQRVRAREFIHQPMALTVKYESPAGDYATGALVNISGGGMRLADLREPLEIGSKVPLFLLRDSEVLFSLNGEVKGVRIQADGRFETTFALVGMSADSERRLSSLLFGS
jgi:CheY-like chemotaxis protein